MKLELLWPRKTMASCFVFRVRTNSLDLHQLKERRKLSKISKLFRSNSEDNVKGDSPKSSPRTSPKGGSPKESPTGVVKRRRLLRVVKDDQSAGEEYDNPHIIRHYTKQYVKEQWSQRSSAASFDEQNLPYIVSGHTILKKTSVESPTGSRDQLPVPKHASFKEEVEIIEFDKKGKIKTCECFTHVEKLQDSDEEAIPCVDICDFCEKRGTADCPHVSSDSDQSDSDLRHRPTEASNQTSTITSSTENTRTLQESEQCCQSHNNGVKAEDEMDKEVCEAFSKDDDNTDCLSSMITNRLIDVHIDQKPETSP